MNKKVVSSVLGLVLAGLVSTAVAGGKPIIAERFENSGGPFLDPGVSALCGFDVLFEFHEKGKFTLFADDTSRFHINYEYIFTNPANGKVLYETAASNAVTPPAMIVEDDVARTRTIIFTDIVRGLPFKWSQPGTGVLLRDAGSVVFTSSIVFDLDNGNFLDFSQEISGVKGPHPRLFLEDDEFAAIGCGALE